MNRGGLLRLDATALPFVGPTDEALRDEPSHSGRPSRRDQMTRSFRSQPVRHRKLVVEVLQAPHRGERSHLMHDRARPARRHRFENRGRVEPIDDDGFRTLRAKGRAPFRFPRGGDDVVPAGNKKRHESPADGSRRTRKEDSHGCLPPRRPAKSMSVGFLQEIERERCGRPVRFPERSRPPLGQQEKGNPRDPRPRIA